MYHVLPYATGVEIERCVNGNGHASFSLLFNGRRRLYIAELTRQAHVETIRQFILPRLRGQAAEQCRAALKECGYIEMFDKPAVGGGRLIEVLLGMDGLPPDERHLAWTTELRLKALEACIGITPSGVIEALLRTNVPIYEYARTL